MREIRWKVGQKTSKKRWIITYFYDVTWLIFETPCSVTTYNSSYRHNKPNQFGIIIYHQISNPWITGYVTSQKAFSLLFKPFVFAEQGPHSACGVGRRKIMVLFHLEIIHNQLYKTRLPELNSGDRQTDYHYYTL